MLNKNISIGDTVVVRHTTGKVSRVGRDLVEGTVGVLMRYAGTGNLGIRFDDGTTTHVLHTGWYDITGCLAPYNDNQHKIDEIEATIATLRAQVAELRDA